MRKAVALLLVFVAALILLLAVVPVAAGAQPEKGELHLSLVGREEKDPVTDLCRLEKEAFLLGRDALKKHPEIALARVRVYYPGWSGSDHEPVMELLIFQEASRVEEYRQEGYARPLHLLDGWGEGLALVRYRYDVFDLFRQAMVGVEELEVRG